MWSNLFAWSSRTSAARFEKVVRRARMRNSGSTSSGSWRPSTPPLRRAVRAFPSTTLRRGRHGRGRRLMRSPLGVGLLADQGGSAHVAGVLTDHPHVHLRWVVPAAGDTTAHGAVFPAVDPGRLDALLVDDDLDVVVVDAPLHRRGDAVRDALEADKHVLVLGPLAGSLGQAE